MEHKATPFEREQRHEARRTQTYKQFLKRLEEIGGYSEEQAEDAAVAVLCALEQRLFSGEAQHLNAQLPAILRELVRRCPLHRGAFPRRFGREEFFRLIAEDLGPEAGDLEETVRNVFAAVRSQITDGEADDVAAQLPSDLLDLWQAPV